MQCGQRETKACEPTPRSLQDNHIRRDSGAESRKSVVDHKRTSGRAGINSSSKATHLIAMHASVEQLEEQPSERSDEPANIPASKPLCQNVPPDEPPAHLFDAFPQQVSSVTAAASSLEPHGLTVASASVSNCSTAESWPSAHLPCSPNHYADDSIAGTCNGSGNHCSVPASAAGNGSNALTAPIPKTSGGALTVIVAVPASNTATQDLNATLAAAIAPTMAISHN